MACKFSFSRFIIGLTLGSIALCPIAAKATHISGSDITYRWLSGNSYEVTVTLYRDCSGVDVGSSVNLNYRSVSCSSNLNAVLALIPGTGIEITQPCSSATTSCNGGTNPGIQQYMYRGTITLPAQCTDWVFSYRVCARNCAITTLSYSPPNCNGIPCLYVEATLNNVMAPTNSSPTFTNVPVAFVCIGQAFNYNHGAVDANGDSLAYSFVTPRDNAATNVNYISAHSATQPLLSTPPMTLDSRYGDIAMTPTASEVSIMAVLIREYRNGVLIGSIIRDIQVWTQVCSNILPTASGINGTSNYNVTVCAGTSVNFTINSNDNNPGQIVSMNWNYGIAGATFTTSGSPYMSGAFSWTPTLSDVRAQPYTFTVIVRDNNCPSNGFQIYSYSITVTNITVPVTTTNSLCAGVGTGTATAATGGGTPPFTYFWSPGGATTSLVTGLFPGNYLLTVTDSRGCTRTVYATVASQSALLSSINSSSHVSCFNGNNGTATVSVSGGSSPYVYSWAPSGGNAAVATGLAAGSYTVTVRDANNCTRLSTVSILQPAVLTASIPSRTNVLCFGGSNATATVLASGGTGPYDYAWSPSGGTSSTATGLSAGNYSVAITDAHGCNATAAVPITQPTSLSLSVSVTPATCGSANGSASTSLSGGTAPYTYVWSPGGATTTSLTGIPAGARTVTVTDANGCIATASSAISNIGGPSVSIAAINPVACFGGTNGSAAVSVNGGTPPLSYTWFPSGGNAASATGLAAGNYTVTIRDGNNCSSSISANVTQPASMLLNPSATDLSCFGSVNGSASVNVTGGTGPFAYLWSPGGSTSQTLNGISAGSYSVTVTDFNGCSKSNTVVVAQPLSLSATISSSTNVTCNGNNNGSAILTASGGTGPYVYSWAPAGGAAAAAAGLAPGNYAVTVTDANNCTRTTDVTISQPAALSLVPSATNVLCSGGNGSASVVVSGGTAPYSYSWSPGSGTSFIASGLAAGNYTITVTDARNCLQSSTVSILQPAPFVSSILQSSAVSCFGGNNGSAAVAASGGTAPYTYLWSPSGGTNSIASGLTARNYTVTVRDANNCIQTSSVSITQPALLAASLPGPTHVSCYGGTNGSATVSASGGTAPYSFNWTAGNIPDTITASGLAAGNYAVTVSDALGCTISTSVLITQPSILNASTSTGPATCGSANGLASVTASGGTSPYTYLWAPSGATSTSISGVAAGAYSLIVTDAHGCSVTTSAAVSNIGGPSASIASIAAVSCYGGNNGSAVVSVNGGTAPFTFTWSPSGGATANAAGLAAGNYTVTIRDGNNCSSSVSANVTQPPLLQLSSSSADLACFGSTNGSAAVAANGGTGPYSYLWSPGGNTSQSLNEIGAGTYSVTVSDLNGCSRSTSVTVLQPTALSASISTSTNVSCFGNNNGSAAVVANGGTASYSYSWSPSGGTSPNASGLAAGSYSVSITDANNCIRNTNISISQPPVLAAVPTATNVACASGTGSVSVVATGGTTPYSYAWSPSGGTATTAPGLAAGNYSVVVTDANNCLQSVSVSITQPAVLTASISASSAVTCFGGNNGSATMAASGGTAPYLYSWSPSGGTATVASGLAAGNYTVTVTDARNCTRTVSVSITQPAVLASSIPSSSQVSCFGANNGSAVVSVSGGTAPYVYTWLPSGGNAPSASGLAAGNYSVTITDARNCVTTSSISITQPTALNASASTIPATCGSANGSASTSVSGGTGPYAFLWSPSGTTSNALAGVSSGAYSVTVTDAYGCSTTASAAVSNIGGPSASVASIAPVSCFGGTNGSAVVSVNGGTAPFTYTWFPSGGSVASATGLAAGNYTVTIRDGNNCSSSVSANITQPSLLQLNPSSSNLSCLGSSNGSASVTASGGAGSYSYAWTPTGSTSQSLNGIGAGTYSVTVSDLNGCSRSTSVTVLQPTALSASISTSTNVSCFGNNNGSAAVVVNGGTAPYSYSWSPSGGTSPNAFGLVAGNYTVSVTDAGNCVRNTNIVISQPLLLSAIPSVTNASCYGSTGTATLTTTGGTLPYSYTWSPSGGNSAVATGLSSGNYSVAVTDALNCSQMLSVTISQPLTLVLSVPSTAGVSCYGGTNGSASVLASGGTSPYLYSWSPTGGTSSFASGLPAGNYFVTVTDSNNCSQTSDVVIQQPSLLVSSISLSSDASCFGANNGSAVVSILGGTTPYSYSWFPAGGNNASASGLYAGNYSVSVTDAFNCTSTSTAVIAQPPALTLATTTSNATCGIANGSVSVALSGGTGPYDYLWSPSGATTAVLSGLTAGAFNIRATDAHGCSLSTSAAISDIGGPAVSISALSSVLCYGDNNGSASVFVSNGTAPFTYSWFPTGGNSATSTNLRAGDYVVTITDSNHCQSSIPVTIVQPPPLSVALSSTPANCYGEASGSVSALVSGGTSPYLYSWDSAGSTTSSNANLVSGNYFVTITDRNGCSQTASVTVSQPTALSAAITSSTDVSCFGSRNGSALVLSDGGTMPYSYQWSPSGGTSSHATGLAAGIYSVQVADRNNCIQNANVAISQPAVLSILPLATNAPCAGENGSASAVVSGGTAPYTYSWSPSGGNAALAPALAPGNYSVRVTDFHNCIQSAVVSISQPPLLLTFIPVSSSVTCYGSQDGSATVVVSGGTLPYSYSWSPSGGTTDVATGIPAGSFAVAVTDANQCTQTSSVLISQPALLSASIPVSTNASCFGDTNGSATVSILGGTSPYSFAWSPSGGNAPSAAGLIAGTYSVNIVDAHGCIASAGIEINEPEPVFLYAAATAASCYGFSDGSAMVDVISGGTPPFFFGWLPLGGNNNSAQLLPAGYYTVTVNDGNGCIQSTGISVNQPPAVTLSLNSTDVSCYGYNNGSAFVNVSGGTSPYAYLWLPGGNTSSMSDQLAAGLHSIIVTDANNCVVSENIIVHQPDALSMSVQGSATICIGQSAILSVNVSGGISPYLYQWSNGNLNATQVVSPFATTAFSIDVHDANGCTLAQENLTITVNPPLDVVANGIHEICEGDHAVLSAQAFGGDGGPYTYSWNQGFLLGNTISVIPVHDTTFTVIVTDGCGTPAAMDSVSLRVNPLPDVSFLPQHVEGCTPVRATFFNHAVASPGSTLFWNLGDNTFSSEPNPSHQYVIPGQYDVSLFVITGEGCTGYLAVPNAVTVFSFPAADFSQSTDVVSFLDPNVQFIDKSTDAVIWEWNFGDGCVTSSERNPLHAYADTGNYKIRLAVQSVGGCVDSIHSLLRVEDQFAIYIPNAFTPNGDGINDVFIAFGVGYTEYDMLIIDRWGKQIFHSTGKNQPWDGTYFGNQTTCQNDVYEYIIKVYDNHQKERTFIGHVTLVR